MDTKEFAYFCINLDHRTDRWTESQKQFESVGINPYRFSGIMNENPVVGCALSHFRVLELAKAEGKHAVIFEDDVQFVNNPNIKYFLDEASWTDWDMLYLGANITSNIYPIFNLFGRLTSAQSTHAYCVNYNFIDTILGKRHLLGKHMDLIYSEDIVPYHRCYITIPMLAIQRPSYSDIEKKKVDYSWMQGRYDKYLIERLS